jgi:DNA polymerase elongation subunit (family B)
MQRLELVGTQEELKSFNLQVISSNPTSKFVWLFGVDAHGLSVAARVVDFQPCFYVRTKHKSIEPEELMERFNEALFLENDPGDHIERIEHCQKKRFVGAALVLDETKNYVRKTYNLLKIVCANVMRYHKVRKAFQDDAEKWVIHDDFDISNQFLQQTNVQYQSWVELKEVSLVDNKCTHCNIECAVHLKDVAPSTDNTSIPRTLKCFLNVACVSRDGTVDVSKRLFRPDPERMFDRVSVCCLTYIWSDSLVPIRKQVFSLLGTKNTIACANEQVLFAKLQESILSHDPDTIMYFPDVLDPMYFIAKRATQHLQWERFRGVKMKLYKKQVSLYTRTLFDLRAPVRKRASVLIEAYDLHTISCHKDLRKPPEKPSSFRYTCYDFPNLIRSEKTRHVIVDETVRDNDLIVALERDCNFRIEYANLSKISNCGLYETVSRGEQIRVFNKLSDSTNKHEFFINKQETARGPYKFSITERPPTFPDPPEAEITTKLRVKSTEDLDRKLKRLNEKPVKRAKLAYVDPFAAFSKTTAEPEDSSEEEDDSEDDEDKTRGEEESIKEGGNVVLPCPNFYPAPIPVLDFASLYPNIMRAFNISYENIVTRLKYADLPGVKYIYVAINANETVAIVDQKGLMGELLASLISERSKVKKLMEKEEDPFKKTNYNKQQESIKVICNATYGFCGAEAKGSLLAMKAVMYIVTSLGRYLQKTVATYLADQYGMAGIYGDTDSVFPNPGDMNPTRSELKSFTEAIARKYKMSREFLVEKFPGFFDTGFTWEAVVHYYRNRDEPPNKSWRVDLEVVDAKIARNAIMFIVYKKLADETSNLFRTEINLEFENMLDNLWMGHVKKHYFGRKWNPDEPHKAEPYLKITGMASKKRDWCIFTRNVLNQVQKFMAFDEAHLARTCVIDAMHKLASGKVPIDELKISCKFKGELAYKNFNSKQMQVVLKMEKRHRCKIDENSRIFFVILRGNENLYMRAETPEHVVEHNLPIDIQYYLEKQFKKPVKKLFNFMPHLIDFDKEFNQVLANVTRGKTNMVDVADQSTNRKRLRLDDLQVVSKQPQKKPKQANNALSGLGVCQSIED